MLQVWSQFGYFGTVPGAPSSRWDLIEDACDAIGLQLLEQHGGDGLWEKLENMWSDGLVELTQLLEIHQVPACLLVGLITFWFGLQLVSVLEFQQPSTTQKVLDASPIKLPSVKPNMKQEVEINCTEQEPRYALRCFSGLLICAKYDALLQLT